MHGFLLFLGAGFVLVGVILVVSNLKNVARRERVLATATSPISQAMGGPVEIRGNIVPSEKGLVEAPLSGRQAVWTRVTVDEFSGGQYGGSSTVLNEVNGRPFFVDDSSGEVARIIPDGANVVLDQQSIGNSGQFQDPPPGFEEFLNMRGLSSKGLFGNKTMNFYEELLSPGDTLYARGPSRREQREPNSEDSGTAPAGQLVMYADTGTDGELILTNKTEKQLASRLLRNFVIGVACTIVGAFIITGAIVWAPPSQASQAQAQSDLAALRHDDNFVAGDLRALSSDAHLADPDLAATKSDAALGTDCYNVSTVKIDATNLKLDASTVSIDLSTLTSDFSAVTQDVAAMKNDLANLSAKGLPATPRATAAIAAADKAIGHAAAKANGEIDQVNTDVTQAYSIANGMATGSCAGDGPGPPPVPIRHIPSS